MNFDVIGIGVGPANLALVTAFLDARDRGEDLPSAIFLERSPVFAWHPGMILPGSRLQVPFLKDLATLRNPRSRYTFLNYLFEEGRLEEFVNLREFFPWREEFCSYMNWIADQAGSLIRFGMTVTELRPVIRHDLVEQIEVADSMGQVFTARALVIANGCQPILPPDVTDKADARIQHTSSLKTAIDLGVWAPNRPHRFLVVGGGQSAAEAACFLLNQFAQCTVELCFRQMALAAADDNPFVNAWFFGRTVDTFYDLGANERKKALEDLSAANLGVVERRVLDELYRYVYQGMVRKEQRLTIWSGHELLTVEAAGESLRCIARDISSGELKEREVDGLIVGTGYRDVVTERLIRPLDRWLLKDESGYVMEKDHRLRSTEPLKVPIYLRGTRQDRHGPAELNLSAHAYRAGVLFKSLRERLQCDRTNSAGVVGE